MSSALGLLKLDLLESLLREFAETLWRSRRVGERKRLQIYNSLVLPVLTYNMSTWALTQKETQELEAFHRRQLRSVIGISYPQIISNEDLHKRTDSEPFGVSMFDARWRMLGHTLRMSNNVPAKQATMSNFALADSPMAPGFQRKPRTTLATVLEHDISTMKIIMGEHAEIARNTRRKRAKKEIYADEQLAQIYGALPSQLKTIEDINCLEKLAKARTKWKRLVDDAHAWLSQRENPN